MERPAEIPIVKGPRDVMREGLPVRETGDLATRKMMDATNLVKQQQRADVERMENASAMYGMHMAFRLKKEEEFLSQPMSIPGVPVKPVGLEIVRNELDTFGFQDVYTSPAFESTKIVDFTLEMDKH